MSAVARSSLNKTLFRNDSIVLAFTMPRNKQEVHDAPIQLGSKHYRQDNR